jgi:hypothetical protein
MARVFNGSTQYLSASSTLLTNEPIDMTVLANADAATGVYTALSLGNSGAATGIYASNMRGDVASDPTETIKQSDAATNGIARTSTGFTAATWHALGSTFISDTSRATFIDGGSKVSDTTNVADPTPDYITIGASRRSALANYFDGSIAEAYILDANMSDAVHASVALGYSPIWSAPLGNVRGWYPLQNDNNNRMAGGYPDLTATGSPTDVIHPFNVVYPSINGLITM